jgi:glycosyltransferase involved in cell wall biosynthesis
MGNQVIVRPCYNRPEMLQLSIEYELAAREYLGDIYHTIFVVEYGSPSIVLDIIDQYPYSKSVIQRTQQFGLSKNILEGLKTAFTFADDWLIYIEDDILVHSSYFKYIYTLLAMPELSNYSVLSPASFDDSGDVCDVRKDRHYAALAPLISKKFFMTYVEPCADDRYYNNHHKFVLELNNLYSAYQHDRTYRFKNAQQNQQAGLINRLCDVARIEEGMSVVMPSVNRIQHIGIYGHNRRKGTDLQGNGFQERLEHLRLIIQDKDLMYAMAGSKEYNDYKIFSPKLDSWDGTLRLNESLKIS